jgi:hypothetical protein
MVDRAGSLLVAAQAGRPTKGSIVKRIVILVSTAVLAGGLLGISPASASPRAGELHVTKECSQYHGKVGEFCTITSSNIEAIKVGARVVYLQAMSADGSLDSDVVISRGHGSKLFGHVTLNATTMTITFSGGTGPFTRFAGKAAVSVTDPGTAKELWHWDGVYQFGSGAPASDD